MAASMLGSLLRIVRQVVPSSASGQARSYYVDWRMLRDVKRRKMAYEYADERLRINSLRKNTILPKHLQKWAKKQTVRAKPETLHGGRRSKNWASREAKEQTCTLTALSQQGPFLSLPLENRLG
uniref:Mitochondrial ribosomal protein S14 n=1 Tax=Ovis aries TaxID=9940 RepID=A0AC11EQT8_SHEEP